MTHELTFRGTTVRAEPGQSVGAALVAAGILDWRTTRVAGRPRGLFCGIGVCFDCLITVDGVPDQRACLVPARDGMRLGDEPAPGDGEPGGGHA
ncbi:(2Fe-2S)-binding protein [Nonomuraea spiralis]|uniref:(2Fe-2S)-binding protein n=1 Tax=Nonomuraea spiralis TaxID=46182 RepID=A0ABV5IPH9_9ACTN|nr:(2Fe-2S)-binding protein [Nonomuraea spiralis]GGT00967.1 proline dehydrogenase [Nonomuraea spiralis]